MSSHTTALTLSLRARLAGEPLRTERLTLRLPRTADATLVYDGYARDLEAIRWMGFRPHPSVETSQAVVDSWIANWAAGKGMLALMMEADGSFVGVIDLTVGPNGAVIGYILCRTYWGRGLATEAARVVVDLAFDYFRVWRVWATCAPQNPASRRVLEKVGMRHEGVLRRWIISPLVSPEPRDSDCLAITRDDWTTNTGREGWPLPDAGLERPIARVDRQ